jgi:transposase
MCFGRQSELRKISAHRVFLSQFGLANDRRSVRASEGVLWLARVGAPWRDLPAEFGKWNSVFQAVPAMGGQRRVRTAFQEIVRRPGFRIRAHRRSHHPRPPARDGRKRGTQNQAIGRSRGGLTTKIVALVDALGNLARFILLPGQRYDSVGVEPLLDGVAVGALIGDKGFDIDWLRRELDKRGVLAVIPPKADRKSD